MINLNLKKRNPDYIAALQNREYLIENFLNKIRFAAVAVLIIMDVVFLAVKGIPIDASIITMICLASAFMVIYFLLIHHVTSMHRYRFWLKYLISTFDFGLLLAAMKNTGHERISEQFGIGMSLPFFYVLTAFLLIFISSLRYGLPIIIYNTFIGMMFSVFFFYSKSGDMHASLYIFGYISGAGIVSGIISESMTHLVINLRKREKLMRFLSKEVVDSIDAGLIRLDLGGEEKHVTILMADIRGFTEMLEKKKPGDIVMILNEYFTVMTDVIYEYGGIVDKFMGDAIMALFGIPEEKGGEPYNAVMAAKEMLAELNRLNEKYESMGFDPLKIGIAIHCGNVIAGNIGSEKRMDYTVIGDAVNVASRLEGLNKKYGTSIVFSEETNSRICDKIPSRFLEKTVLRGRTIPTMVYTVLEKVDPDRSVDDNSTK